MKSHKLRIVLNVISYLMIIDGVWLAIVSIPFTFGFGIFNGGSTFALVYIMSELSILIVYFGFRELYNKSKEEE